MASSSFKMIRWIVKLMENDKKSNGSISESNISFTGHPYICPLVSSVYITYSVMVSRHWTLQETSICFQLEGIYTDLMNKSQLPSFSSLYPFGQITNCHSNPSISNVGDWTFSLF